MGIGRRAATAMACTAVAAVTLAACGSGGGGGAKSASQPSKTATRPAQAGAGANSDSPSASPTPTQILAQIKGGADMEVTINTAVRDSGGFVTIQGVVANNGSQSFDANVWRGNETALSASGASVAGAYLIDEAGKKRYYVLRDTDGKCLCTMGLIGIQPHETRPFFAQFPAPPAATNQVEFDLPTMPPAKITLSDAKG